MAPVLWSFTPHAQGPGFLRIFMPLSEVKPFGGGASDTRWARGVGRGWVPTQEKIFSTKNIFKLQCFFHKNLNSPPFSGGSVGRSNGRTVGRSVGRSDGRSDGRSGGSWLSQASPKLPKAFQSLPKPRQRLPKASQIPPRLLPKLSQTCPEAPRAKFI